MTGSSEPGGSTMQSASDRQADASHQLHVLAIKSLDLSEKR